MKVSTAYWPVPTLGHRQSGHRPSLWSARLRQVWYGLMSRLDVSDEPHVWPTYSAPHPPAWNAYDPITGQSIHLVSESELRIWLEELHYREQRYARDRQAQLKLLWTH
jgi:hypothetical protein